MAKLGQLGQPNLVELKPWTSMHKSITLPMITAWGRRIFPAPN